MNEYLGLIEAIAILASAAGIIVTLVATSHLSHRRATLDAQIAQRRADSDALIAQRRATLDLLLMEETKPEVTEQRMAFNRLREQGSLSQWAIPENINSENTALLRAILNRYELVSIGVHQGIIDEESYRTWCRTTLVKDWTICKPFVAQLRQTTGTPVHYCEFEKLARRWASTQEEPHV